MAITGEKIMTITQIDTNRIYETTNYSKFKQQKGNRYLDKKNLTQLKVSISENYLRNPIIVNENYEIIDGQHRFNICQELKKPIYYIINVGYGLAETKRLNAVSRTWTTEDYLNAYVADNISHYVNFNTLYKRYSIPLTQLLTLFGHYQNKTNIREEFIKGTFTSENEELVYVFLERLQLFSGFKQYTSSNFIKAFFRLFCYEKYNHEKMEKQWQKNAFMMEKQTTMSEYLLLLTKNVYSYSSKTNVIYYDANNDKFFQ